MTRSAKSLGTLASSAVAMLWLAAAHPADGPDVDVRVLVSSEAVTCTILLNLAFADEVVAVPREEEMALHPVEHPSYRDALQQHFASTNSVKVDGMVLVPTVKSFEVFDADLTLLPLFPRMGAKALTKLQLVLEYPLRAPAKRVTVAWGVFPPDRALETALGTPPMQVVVQWTAKGLRSRVELTEDEPEYSWHDTGESLIDRLAAVPEPKAPPTIELPLLSLGLWAAGLLGGLVGLRRRAWLALAVPLLAFGFLTTGIARTRVPDPRHLGAALPTAEEATAIFAPLHSNVYRAFDLVVESDIYDALARSVHGALLERLYQQIYRSLILQEEGGAVCQVEAVRLQSTAVQTIGTLPPESQPGFVIRARWQVDGAVHHWGHSHGRSHEYDALYTVVQTPQGWRIRDHEMLAQVLISTSTTDPRGASIPK